MDGRMEMETHWRALLWKWLRWTSRGMPNRLDAAGGLLQQVITKLKNNKAKKESIILHVLQAQQRPQKDSPHWQRCRKCTEYSDWKFWKKKTSKNNNNNKKTVLCNVLWKKSKQLTEPCKPFPVISLLKCIYTHQVRLLPLPDYSQLSDYYFLWGIHEVSIYLSIYLSVYLSCKRAKCDVKMVIT